MDLHNKIKPATRTKVLIHLAESETGMTRFCDLIGGYLCLANQVWESGFWIW